MDVNTLWSEADQKKNEQNTRCLSVNTILAGKYLVGPVLGQGGFGITYKGFDLNMETYVAIKEYFPVELASRNTTTIYGDRVISLGGEKSKNYKIGLEKYVAEAQSISRFSDISGIVSIKDFFYENETAYIVMEYIEGMNLRDYQKQCGGRLSEKEALDIMKPIIEALVQVHHVGVIHRDISPENIMLTFKDGQIQEVKLIDFGAARMTAANGQRSLTIILKHGYAPEEQYRTHGEQGAWTDVYAVCAVLYKLLTGRTPEQAMDRLFQDELQPFAKLGININKNVADAIWKGLSVKKENRFQTMNELAEILYEGKKVKKTGYSKTMIAAVSVGIALSIVLIIGIMMFAKQQMSSKHEMATSENSDAVQESVKDEMSQKEETPQKEEEISHNKIDVENQIAFYHPQNSLSEAWNHVLVCKPDGTVEGMGENEAGQCNVQYWDSIVSVKGGARHSLGLRSDGRVEATGDNNYGQCDVSHWTDVVQIDAGEWHSLGVTKNGEILVAGIINNDEVHFENLSTWTDIKDIACFSMGAVAGLKHDGTVIFEGLENDIHISGWENVEEVFFYENEVLVGLKVDGTVVAESLDGSSEYAKELCKRIQELPKMKQIFSCDQGITKDGTLLNVDINENREAWTNMISVFDENGVIYGLTEEGNLLIDLRNNGNAVPEDFEDLEWVQLVDEVMFTGYTGLIGETKSGKVLYFGSNENYLYWIDEIDGKSKIVDVDEFMMVTEDGTMYASAGDNPPTSGVKEVIYDTEGGVCLMKDGTVQTYGIHVDQQQSALGVKDWTDIKQICGSYWVAGLKEDGTVVRTINGREEEWKQLDIQNVKAICSSSVNCLALLNDGTVKELSSSLDADKKGLLLVDSWTDITQIAMGEAHSVGLKSDGTVVATGSNNFGQCDVEEWKDVVFVDAANQCTIGLTKEGELLITGSFY